MVNLKYTKADRLRKSSDYLRLSKYGNKYFSNHFIIIANSNNFGNRLGVTASKKVGNAITRNRIKRVIREYFRLYIKGTLKCQDINVIAKKGAGELRPNEFFSSLSKAFDYVVNKRAHSILSKI